MEYILQKSGGRLVLTKKTSGKKAATGSRKGRPRTFDLEAALCVAQALFHRDGFDAVSVQDLSEAMGIRASSFYAAFGSKLDLFERVLARYQGTGSLDVGGVLEKADAGKGLRCVLDQAAHLYACNPEKPGCMAIEAETSANEDVRALGAKAAKEVVRLVRSYAAGQGLEAPDGIARYVQMCLRALSMEARRGATLGQLRQLAVFAGAGVSG